jgi:hypothetical protein
MRRDLLVYAISAIVIVVSFLATYLLPIPDSIRGLITLPGIAGLFSFLIQAWHDQRAHERSIELQQQQEGFSLAIASHMAEVVFDKQVSFCEEYSQTLHEAVIQLWQTGPSTITNQFERDLRNLRGKYSPWLSQELQNKLLPFEMALREIATDDQLLGVMPVGPARTEFVDRMYKAFTTILGIPPIKGENSPEAAATTIIEHLKDVLDVSDLVVFSLNSCDI